MFRLNHRSIKVTLFSEIHIKIISKISLTYHQIASYMYYRIYQTKCKVYITKNNKYITLCEKDYYVWIIMFGCKEKCAK